MDVFDQVTDREIKDRELCIKAAITARTEPVLKPAGTCYNCGETVTGQQLFCDGDCRQDYTARNRRKSRGY